MLLCTNQIPALGYVMYLTSIKLLHWGVYLTPIISQHFIYLVPIIAFLANDVMELGGCAQIMTLIKYFGLI